MTPLRQLGVGKMSNVITAENVCTSPNIGRAGRTHAHRALSPSSLLLDPNKQPVYAGDVGPETWVVELPGRAVPVTLPLVAVLAGFLSPHAYVLPVHQVGLAQPSALRSIA